MAILKNIFSFIISIISFCLTFYSIGKLMLFLSKPKSNINVVQILLNNLMSNKFLLQNIIYELSIDTILIILFILQHTLMKTEFLKNIWKTIYLENVERCFYNMATSGVLLFLIDNWRRTSSFTIWFINTDNNNTIYWTFMIVHIFAWILIYGGSILMDLAEILGLKQVFYEFNKLNSPMSYKSPELRRLYSNIRHPSFIGLSLILWATNCMTLDRLVLSVMWTAYMYLAWRTEPKDLAYQKNQLIKKKYELTHLN